MVSHRATHTTQVLEPLGWQRRLYRTEVHPRTGRTIANDFPHPQRVREEHIVRVNASTVAAAAAGSGYGGGSGGGGDGRLCNRAAPFTADAPCTHEHYAQTKHSFFGMWIATARLLDKVMTPRYRWT